MIAGKFVSGAFRALSTATYLSVGAESVPHQVYEVRVTTVPLSAERERDILEKLMSARVSLSLRQGLDVIAVEAGGNRVRIQVTGSPFLWAPFLALLPTIIGPIIALVVGLVLIYRIPEWAWAAIPLGIGGAVLVYALTKTRK